MSGTGRAERMVAVLVPSWEIISAAGHLEDAAVTVLQGRVASTTALARAAGVRRGQRVRDAERACPGLHVYRGDPGAEGRAFEPVIRALEHVAAGIEAVRPGLCVLRASGIARYYGSEFQAAAELREAVAGVEVGETFVGAGVGFACGSVAAALAARSDLIVPEAETAEFLAGFDLDVLGRPQLAAVLRALGIVTLGQLAALPAASVASRFGAEGLSAHRLARGLDTRVHAPRIAAADLAVSRAFDPAEQLVEPLVFVAKALADQLHEQLARLGLSADRVEITATVRGGTSSRRWWRHEGQLSSRAVAERTRWQLSSAIPVPVEDADPDHGFTALALRPDGLRPATGRQLVLLGPEPLPQAVDDVVERLQGMLGYAAVTRPVLQGGRDPGERIARVPFGDLAPASRGDGPWPGAIPRPDPVRVPAAAVEVGLLDTEGRTVLVSGRGEYSAPPALLVLDGERHRVAGCSSPWVADRSWLPGGLRRARVQVTLADGRAFLIAQQGGAWKLIAGYQ